MAFLKKAHQISGGFPLHLVASTDGPLIAFIPIDFIVSDKVDLSILIHGNNVNICVHVCVCVCACICVCVYVFW